MISFFKFAQVITSAEASFVITIIDRNDSDFFGIVRKLFYGPIVSIQ